LLVVNIANVQLSAVMKKIVNYYILVFIVTKLIDNFLMFIENKQSFNDVADLFDFNSSRSRFVAQVKSGTRTN
jgi:hypothetical protein